MSRRSIAVVAAVLVFALVIGIGVYYWGYTPEKRAERHYQLALRYEQSGDLANALAEIKRARTLAPDDPDILTAARRIEERRAAGGSPPAGTNGDDMQSDGTTGDGGSAGAEPPNTSPPNEGTPSSGSRFTGSVIALLPSAIPGYVERAASTKPDVVTARYFPASEEVVEALTVNVYAFDSGIEAGKFVTNVGTQLFPNDGETTQFRGSNAVFGRNDRNEAFYGWAKLNLAFEIVIKGAETATLDALRKEATRVAKEIQDVE